LTGRVTTGDSHPFVVADAQLTHRDPQNFKCSLIAENAKESTQKPQKNAMKSALVAIAIIKAPVRHFQ
jgi:hypothetical protein